MTDLSPAAQAVLDAWTASENGVYLEGDPERLAAALRASADGCDSDWIGLTVIHHLYAIADELETHQ